MQLSPRTTLQIMFLATVLALVIFGTQYTIGRNQNSAAILLPLSSDVDTVTLQQFGLIKPVAQFDQRITKKPFGVYITPDTSPVQNDKFTGYHTGVDLEFTDALDRDTPVRAIADGEITYRGWMSGYGGIVVIRHTVNGARFYALYGHLDAARIPTIVQVKAGDALGVLGDDHSHETDGVRKHLHFSIYTGATMDYRGYVPEQDDLSAWIDPLRMF